MYLKIHNHINDKEDKYLINDIEQLNNLLNSFGIKLNYSSLEEGLSLLAEELSRGHTDAWIEPSTPFSLKQLNNNLHQQELLEKGLRGDWRKEGYVISHDQKPDHLHVMAHKDGQLVGEARIKTDGHTAKADYVQVDKNHRRKGIASGMYQHVEKVTGTKMSHSGDATKEGDALWSQQGRKFGKLDKADKDEYAGEHTAPGPDDAPLHNLSGTYPEDIYSHMAAQYYGHGVPYDHKAISVIHGARNRPKQMVRIYRAVPYTQTPDERLAEIEKHKAYIQKNGQIPPGVNTPKNRSEYYEDISNEAEKLKLSPPVAPKKLSINKGDWVTTTAEYAHDHGHSALNGKFKVLSKLVPASHVFTDGNSIHEFGYNPPEKASKPLGKGKLLGKSEELPKGWDDSSDDLYNDIGDAEEHHNLMANRNMERYGDIDTENYNFKVVDPKKVIPQAKNEAGWLLKYPKEEWNDLLKRVHGRDFSHILDKKEKGLLSPAIAINQELADGYGRAHFAHALGEKIPVYFYKRRRLNKSEELKKALSIPQELADSTASGLLYRQPSRSIRIKFEEAGVHPKTGQALYHHVFKQQPYPGETKYHHLLSTDKDGKEGIGAIEATHSSTSDSPAIERSGVKAEHRRMGLGKLLYQKALEHHGKLKSDYALSPSANAVWSKLANAVGVSVKRGQEGTMEPHVAELKKDVGRINFNKLAGEKGWGQKIPTRPDQEVKNVQTPRQVELGLRQAAAPDKKFFSNKVSHAAIKMANTTLNPQKEDHPKGVYVPSTLGTGKAMSIGEHSPVTAEHEGLHYLMGQIRSRHGQEGASRFINSALALVHPEDLHTVGKMIAGHYQDNDYLPEEKLAHVRDILTDPKTREAFHGHHFEKYMNNETKTGSQEAVNRLKASWKAIRNMAKEVGSEHLENEDKMRALANKHMPVYR